VKALKNLEYESIKQLNVNFHVELHALETKYQQLFAPLDQQVKLICKLNIYNIYSLTTVGLLHISVARVSPDEIGEACRPT